MEALCSVLLALMLRIGPAGPDLTTHAVQPLPPCEQHAAGQTVSASLAEVLRLLSQQQAHAGRYDAAISALDSAISLMPSNPKLYILRGRMYRALYEWDRALDDFNRALMLPPLHAEVYFQRGLLYYSILQTGAAMRQEALADFERYLEMAPEGQYAHQAATYIREIQQANEALNTP